jgi:hypothetical protein
MFHWVLPEDFINEIGSSIAYDHPGHTKARKYDFIKHSLGMF